MNFPQQPAEAASPPAAAASIASADLVSIHDWMADALYHPQHGYYRRPQARVGRAGDFITSVSVGPLFGQLLARRAHTLWQQLDRPNPFHLIEQGAETGQLLADLLQALEALDPALAAATQPWIIEPHLPQREAQKSLLPADWGERCRWFDSPAELPPFTGLFYANELLDAFPAQQFRREPDGWVELGLPQPNPNAVAEPQPLHPASAPLPPGLAQDLPAPWLWEHQPALLPWLGTLSARLQRGLIVLIDYGLTTSELRDPSRRHGSLRGYQNHHQVPPFRQPPGSIDLTVHLHWDELIAHASSLGLNALCFQEQGRYLTHLARPWLLELEANQQRPSPQQLRQFQQLTHPAHLGAKFQVVEWQQKTTMLQ